MTTMLQRAGRLAISAAMLAGVSGCYLVTPPQPVVPARTPAEIKYMADARARGVPGDDKQLLHGAAVACEVAPRPGQTSFSWARERSVFILLYGWSGLTAPSATTVAELAEPTCRWPGR